MRTRFVRPGVLLGAIALAFTSCETVRHQFAGPALDWQARNGQLLYHGKRTTLIGEVLDRPGKRKKLFARYERKVNQAMDVYLRFVDAWYSKEFIEVFLHPQDLFQIPPAVNAVLGGNVGDSFAIKWRMWIFYMLVRLQRYFPLCPRRTLVPQTNGAAAPAEALEVVS